MSARLEFKYVGGDSSLDFVNTVDWTDRGLKNELIANYDDFVRWAEGAGLIAGPGARRLRVLRRRAPEAAARAYRHALQLRSVLQRVVTSVARASRERGTRVDATAMNELNIWLGRALRHLRLSPGVSNASLLWTDADNDLESPLWAIAWNGARLIASDEAGELGVCAGPNCGWAYVDRSRNGLRRWCEMSTCGTQEKSLRRRRRRRSWRGGKRRKRG
jgi:predicted RNA-binding Zn ribbon-like protein